MFADGMKRRRKELGLSQQKLSNISGVPQATISAVESGSRIPREDTMVMIAKGLNCSVGSLLDETKPNVSDDYSYGLFLDLARTLPPADLRRVIDFVSGILAALNESASK